MRWERYRIVDCQLDIPFLQDYAYSPSLSPLTEIPYIRSCLNSPPYFPLISIRSMSLLSNIFLSSTYYPLSPCSNHFLLHSTYFSLNISPFNTFTAPCRPVVCSAVYSSVRDMIRFIWINLVELLYLSPSQVPIKCRGADHTSTMAGDESRDMLDFGMTRCREQRRVCGLRPDLHHEGRRCESAVIRY